jgi:hypothetical protein
MKSYWIKIALGALFIFAVGMGGIYAVRSVSGKINRTMNSTDPITLPIAFVSFKLNGTRLGSIDRVILLRNEPKHISSAKVVLKLNDSSSLALLRGCRLALDDVEHVNEKTSFRCATGDSANGLTPIGFVSVRGTSDSFPLLMPEKAARDLRQTRFEMHGHEFNVSSDDDSASASLEARADSIDAASERVADSISQLGDSIVEAMGKKADSLRNNPPKPHVRVPVRNPHQPASPARP